MVIKSGWSNKYFAIFFMVVMLIILASCSTWNNPISAVDEDQIDRRLPGAWVSEDSKNKIYIGKPMSGWMNFVYYEEDDGIFGKMYVSKIVERYFLNVQLCNLEENNSGCSYLIYEYKIEGEKATVFSPDDGFVDKAITNKQLIGESGDGFSIYSGSEEIMEFIRTSPKEELFPADQVAVFLKVR
jgi:hypothetical protein